MTRAFVAIRPPATVLDAIEARVNSVAMRSGRPTSREQWHLTVQFLGDDADVDAVACALSSGPLALAASVDARLAPLGYTRDRAPEEFVPHLTLARFREPTDLRRLGAAIGPEAVGPSWRAEEVVLYESVLREQGARHIVRAEFRFP